jgi:hypothetical protein
MTDTVTLTTSQAEQILHQLSICNDLLQHGPDSVRVALHDTLTLCHLTPGDVDQFLDALAHSHRYLDARLATERHRNQANNNEKWGQIKPAQWGQMDLSFSHDGDKRDDHEPVGGP